MPEISSGIKEIKNKLSKIGICRITIGKIALKSCRVFSLEAKLKKNELRKYGYKTTNKGVTNERNDRKIKNEI